MLTACLKLVIIVYRNLLSPMMLQSCRFAPSCSIYAWQAVNCHGAVKGTWLTLKRLFRCHPFSQHVGADPVE